MQLTETAIKAALRKAEATGQAATLHDERGLWLEVTKKGRGL